MKRAYIIAACMAAPAFAGDSVTLSGPVEILMPTVIEVADYGLLWAPGLGGRYTDDELRTFVFDGDPLPPVPVPLPGAGLMLAAALLMLYRGR